MKLPGLKADGTQKAKRIRSNASVFRVQNLHIWQDSLNDGSVRRKATTYKGQHADMHPRSEQDSNPVVPVCTCVRRRGHCKRLNCFLRIKRSTQTGGEVIPVQAVEALAEVKKMWIYTSTPLYVFMA
jgi:hypothetical protein